MSDGVLDFVNWEGLAAEGGWYLVSDGRWWVRKGDPEVPPQPDAKSACQSMAAFWLRDHGIMKEKPMRYDFKRLTWKQRFEILLTGYCVYDLIARPEFE